MPTVALCIALPAHHNSQPRTCHTQMDSHLTSHTHLAHVPYFGTYLTILRNSLFRHHLPIPVSDTYPLYWNSFRVTSYMLPLRILRLVVSCLTASNRNGSFAPLSLCPQLPSHHNDHLSRLLYNTVLSTPITHSNLPVFAHPRLRSLACAYIASLHA